MRRRLLTLCHVFPGLTPMNVWDMQWCDWVLFAGACDAWDEAKRKEAARG